MKILESFLKGKQNNPAICEDGLVISKHIIAVIDGVTTKGTHFWNGMTSGCYAKGLISGYLLQDVENQAAEELLHNLNNLLHEAIQGNVESISCEDYPRASVIIYNDIYKEIWVYGDCQCRINDRVYTHSKKIDDLNADLRAFYLEYYLSKGMNLEELAENDLGRKAIEQNLLMQFAFENQSGAFGYPVLNGMGINKSMIKRYSVVSGDEIILASDGYPRLGGTLKESEKDLKVILEKDPMCFHEYKSTKGLVRGNASFDDRAFCRFKV